ncbi:tRNA guanosine(34) transglycosylase Tgt [Helicobacter ailurogastricus]|uniref:Queuine tRNA-ribosyltransferase n=1 Tax=Helicobacter ailurogastricus TaxID=1578720 RepID=A0A0K2Y6J3_9HELI|nr:tRNA guanosine(34) transglycosylase Tgt [Helicobacter ailurogastricus]CRI32183.1 tRNA-guanine transglycosylase [Helicobacter ailurogastricus]BDQ28657.1 queuine tRNA-ribosyltransferase [Helicobacter ailurogastricus]GLH57322.1 Queuine tRNA-ribosyltransferase Tgt [Helicobacter ailurogastricus]GLH59531.1 Queuine tRNA-ribosyltransferase Tgt [Helicobacter ailurogastricus]GMB90138.1 Queuine tRNA-ribosyltransferase Tgt [Helicobacter ailurogastricus]
MDFTLDGVDKKARAGTLKLAHGKVATPIFMPVGTQASVKSLDALDLQDHLKAPIILGNTYHLYLRPGANLIQKLGGLHKFTKFQGNFLTDSGGFQAFSLKHNTKAHTEGIVFKSHIDGSTHLFTPSKVLDIQYALNSDICMVLDDLVGLPAPFTRLKLAVQKTTEWAKISLDHHKGHASRTNHIFAIVQGGIDSNLRRQSALELSALGFDGYAIGGLAVGESAQEMYATVAYTQEFLPKDKPRYLMGVGTPQDILEAIDLGVDMFDCVMPTRNARNGTLFTSLGKLSIKAQAHKESQEALDQNCACYTCKRYSKAYLHHLFKARELLYFRLASLHNLHFYLELVRGAREAILRGEYADYKSRILSVY